MLVIIRRYRTFGTPPNWYWLIMAGGERRSFDRQRDHTSTMPTMISALHSGSAIGTRLDARRDLHLTLEHV